MSANDMASGKLLAFPDLLQALVAALQFDAPQGERVKPNAGGGPAARGRGDGQPPKERKPAEASALAAPVWSMSADPTPVVSAPPVPVLPLVVGQMTVNVPAQPDGGDEVVAQSEEWAEDAGAPVVGSPPGVVAPLATGAAPAFVQPAVSQPEVANAWVTAAPARADVPEAQVQEPKGHKKERAHATAAAEEGRERHSTVTPGLESASPTDPAPPRTAVEVAAQAPPPPLSLGRGERPEIPAQEIEPSAATPVVAPAVRNAGPAPLAFAARLAPLPPAVAAAPAPLRVAPVSPEVVASHGTGEGAETHAAAPQRPSESAAAVRPLARVRKPESAGEDQEPPPERSEAQPPPPVHQTAISAGVPQRQDATPTIRESEAPPRAAEVLPEEPPAHARTVEPIVRDIRLEVAGPDQRVEVRIEERAGEVRLSVRTPDGALAERLRDHLPALSARLEQSGVRADEWRAADGPDRVRRLEVEPTRSGTADTRQQDGGKGGGQTPQQQPGRERAPHGDNKVNRNQKGRSFAWLMSSFD